MHFITRWAVFAVLFFVSTGVIGALLQVIGIHDITASLLGLLGGLAIAGAFGYLAWRGRQYQGDGV